MNIAIAGFALYGSLWLLSTGVTAGREQETLSAPAAVKQGVTPSAHFPKAKKEREAVMQVAVANVLADQGRPQEALALYKEAIETGETKSKSAYAAAESFAKEKTRSTPDLLRLKEADAKERKRVIQSLLEEGHAWLRQSEYDRAVETFEKVFLLDSLNVKASKGIDKAKTQLIQEKRAEDKTFADQYERDARSAVESEWEKANTLLAQGQTGEARHHFERVLFLDPSHRGARRALQSITQRK